jgi:hypothetical protein
LFAHDAGGFGLAGTDNVITCGQYNCNGAGNATVDLGYEPQLFLRKRRDSTGNWIIVDNMRGFTTGGSNAQLYPNLYIAEASSTYPERITATGVNIVGDVASSTNIYIAIRRGPMKVPTSGTSVFQPIAWSGTGVATSVTGTSFPVDMAFVKARNFSSNGPLAVDRLRNVNNTLYTPYTQAETAQTTYVTGSDLMNGLRVGDDLDTNMATVTYVYEMFRRAPSFFDEVCYTGTGANTTFTHNLGVVPELMIAKNRTSAGYGWLTYSATLGATKFVQLNSTAAEGTVATYWNNTAPTSSVFSVGTAGATNASADSFVAYLFATCAGVSKVGSFTGNGTTQTINCGFTGGARFVMVKATSTTGNWIVADSARGIVAGNDPALYLNSTAAEVTGLDWIDADNSGFVVNETATIAANTNGVSYIFLAVS